MNQSNSYLQLMAGHNFNQEYEQKQLDHLVKVASNINCPNLQHQIDFQSLILSNFNIYSDLLDDNQFLQNQINQKQIHIKEQQQQIESYQQKNNYIMDSQEDAKIITQKLNELDQQINQSTHNLQQKQFYREYDLMKKEMEGLKKQNTNLKEIMVTVKKNLGK